MRTMIAHHGTNAPRSPSRFRGAGLLAARLGLATLATAGIGAGATSCSLLVATDSDQCKVDADCIGQLAGRLCQSGVCVANTVVCKANADCNPAPVGPANKICRKFTDATKNKCVSLTSALCTTVASTKPDGYLDDNAFIFGAILPTVGPDAAYGKVVEDSIKLALDDFHTTNGIPAASGSGTRPLVLVGCNDGPDETQTDVAANYLIDQVGVPAIIGYPFSGNTITVATDVTIPKGVLLFSSAATSTGITTLDDHDLVWRTSPPDTIQAKALNLFYPTIEATARTRYPMIPLSQIKVAIIHTSDAYGAGLATALEAQLKFNGKAATQQSGPGGNYTRINYGSSTAPDTTSITKSIAFGAHITFVFGFNESVDPIFKGIEAGWQTQTDMHRSMWLLADGSEVGVLWNKAVTTEDERQRIIGSVPGVNKNYKPYADFTTAWNASKYAMDGSPDTLGTAGAYDITYMLAYSAVAVGTDPMTGANLVKFGLRNMEPTMATPHPQQVHIGPLTIMDTFPFLQKRTRIDIEGTSGHLDFDVAGEAISDIQIWCLPKLTAMSGSTGMVADPAINSGLYYDSGAQTIAGAVDPKCELTLTKP